MYDNMPGQVWPQPGESAWITRYGGLPPTRALATLVTGEATIMTVERPDGTLDPDRRYCMRPFTNGLMEPVRAFGTEKAAVGAWNRAVREAMKKENTEHAERLALLEAKLLPEREAE